MNFINAKLNKKDGKWYAGFDRYEIELNNERISKVDDSYNGKEVVLGIRPENVMLYKDKADSNSKNLIEAIIDVIEMIGSESYLYMNFGDSQITIRINTSDDYQRDQHAFMDFDLNKLHIFDKDTQKNILVEQ